MLKAKIFSLFFVIVCFFSLFSSPKAHASSNSVDNSERLAFLNQATGASSGNTSTFENRMNALLSTTRTPERAIVITAESSAREENAARNLILEQEASLRAQELSPERYSPKNTKENYGVTDSNASKKSRQDGTEKAYQTEKENIQKEFDERLKKASMQSAANRVQKSSGMKKAALPPELANNPFYHKDDKDPEQRKFDNRKAVIESRLVDQGFFTPEEARSLVGEATSEEDLVIDLMKHNLSYGEASEAAS